MKYLYEPRIRTYDSRKLTAKKCYVNHTDPSDPFSVFETRYNTTVDRLEESFRIINKRQMLIFEIMLLVNYLYLNHKNIIYKRKHKYHGMIYWLKCNNSYLCNYESLKKDRK